MNKPRKYRNDTNTVPNIGCVNLLARYALAGAIVTGVIGIVAKGCVDTTKTLVANVMDTPEQEG